MIDKQALTTFIESRLGGTDLFLVDLRISSDNNIVVEVDSDMGVDIDRCVELTREIEAEFDRDKEDYELEVGSSGLTSPFKVRRQYEKNRGKEVEVLSCDGKKYKGMLQEVGADTFTIISREKVKKEGMKRATMEDVVHTFPYSGVKYTKYLLQF